MCTIVDRNGAVAVVKLHGPKGQVAGYNVEDTAKAPGTDGFVRATCKTLTEARQRAGIFRQAPEKYTHPKSDYAEQGRGYKKPTGKHR